MKSKKKKEKKSKKKKEKKKAKKEKKNVEAGDGYSDSSGVSYQVINLVLKLAFVTQGHYILLHLF